LDITSILSGGQDDELAPPVGNGNCGRTAAHAASKGVEGSWLPKIQSAEQSEIASQGKLKL
jgi:hypothetical protein